MKKVNFYWSLTIFLVLFKAGGISVTAQSTSDPVAYLNSIQIIYTEISKKMWSYTSSVAQDKSAKKIDKSRTDLINEYRAAITKLKGMPAYKEDATYRDAVLEYLQLNLDVLNNDYAKVVDLEAVAEESYDAMEAYLAVLDKAGEKQKEASDGLNVKFTEFAKKHNITIVEGEEQKLTKKLIQADRMWENYNQVFLIFFKSFKQEAYLLDAVNRIDLNAIEQNKNSLIATAKEGLEKLNKVEAFDGDNSLKEACKQVLNFYIKECEKSVPIIIDFFLKKEHFEKSQKTFEGLAKKDRTEEAVNSFNKAVNDYNKSIPIYNTNNETFNNERNSVIENWNKVGNKFKSKHI